jgi:hypothetical protein
MNSERREIPIAFKRTKPLTDEEYAERVNATFIVNASRIIFARQEGRLLAWRDRCHGERYHGEEYARAYRNLAMPATYDDETKALLEQVFLVSYTTTYYQESES